jgi:isopentenyl diphosphate isomerase/L-lactate dehydrogenase-like FMN-dependent dehydrogenase
MGASAVLVGRRYLFALAAGGQAGVEGMIEILRVEIDRAMALLGVCSWTRWTAPSSTSPRPNGPEIRR